MKKLDIELGFKEIPRDHTCEGRDISPGIVVKGAKAVSLAIILDDLDAPAGVFTHWIAWNLEPQEMIPEGFLKSPVASKPAKASQGLNSFGRIGYNGPCPPRGMPHRYRFQIYALDSMLDLPPGSSRRDLENAMKGHILQQGDAVAVFKR